MKQSEHKTGILVKGVKSQPPSLEELRAIRKAQKATNQRVEELKINLFRITEQHMDQAVSLIRRWMKKDNKEN